MPTKRLAEWEATLAMAAADPELAHALADGIADAVGAEREAKLLALPSAADRARRQAMLESAALAAKEAGIDAVAVVTALRADRPA